MATRVTYEPLFTDLETKDAGNIKVQLDKRGIQYRITGNGKVIEVEKGQKYTVRLDLAKEGVIPQGGTIGLEIFNNTKLNSTEFDKKMMFLRAQKGELERTISSLEQVSKARVNITPSNDSVFVEDRIPAKASILLTLEPVEALSEETIKSIVLLAASAVEDLTPEDVEVVDTRGNILTDRIELGDGGSGTLTNKKLKLQKEIEKKLEKNAKRVLSAIGGGNYRVTISVSLDYDKEYRDRESFTTPTVAGEQLNRGLLRSEQNQNESYKGEKNGSASGVPGTDSNIPGYVAEDGNSQGNDYKKSSNTSNYELDKIKSSYTKELGKIKKITVSVVLNKKARYFTDTEFTELERKKFENMVKSAVNFDDKRGDFINVTALPFDTTVQDRVQEEYKAQVKYKIYIYSAIGGVVLLLIIIVIIMTIIKRIEDKKMLEREREAVEQIIPEFEDISLGDQLSVEDQERVDREESIKTITLQKPEEVANLIKSWLTQD